MDLLFARRHNSLKIKKNKKTSHFPYLISLLFHLAMAKSSFVIEKREENRNIKYSIWNSTVATP